MKYMLLMQPSDRLEQPPIHTWEPAEIKTHIQFMHDFNQSLIDSGEFVEAQGLTGPEEAKVVVAVQGGPPTVTDGPYPESKEFLAGYWIVDCDGLERAIEIAAAASASPGPNGVKLNMPIEVRQVMSAPSQDA